MNAFSLSARTTTVALLVLLSLQDPITPTVNRATPHFPTTIDFHLVVTGNTNFDSAEIEVWTDAQACTQSTTRATAEEFDPGTTTTADWTWDLRETGALPPGTTVSWQWALQDSQGSTHRTPDESLTIVDDSHHWQASQTASLTVNWYEGDQDFSLTLQDAGQAAPERLADDFGIQIDGLVRMYIYATSIDMQNATLYAPAWSGGLAFPRYNAVLVAIDPEEVDWGTRVVTHELTHVIVGRYAFSCVERIPNWFDEGLASYMEGPMEQRDVFLLQQAIRADTLLSVRELGFIFSGQSELASLSYAQSLSLVTFLIEEFGSRHDILRLLDEFKQGTSEDRALETVYGVDRDGLEAAWREWVGAAPMPLDSQADRLNPTLYPTLQPLDGPPLPGDSIPVTPEYITLPEQALSTPQASQSSQSIAAAILLSGLVGCVILALAVLGVIIWLALRHRRRPGPEAGQAE